MRDEVGFPLCPISMGRTLLDFFSCSSLEPLPSSRLGSDRPETLSPSCCSFGNKFCVFSIPQLSVNGLLKKNLQEPLEQRE